MGQRGQAGQTQLAWTHLAWTTTDSGLRLPAAHSEGGGGRLLSRARPGPFPEDSSRSEVPLRGPQLISAGGLGTGDSSGPASVQQQGAIGKSLLHWICPVY